MTRYDEVVSRVEHWEQKGAIVNVPLDNIHFIYDQVKWLEEEFTEITYKYTKRLKDEFYVSNSYYDIAAESYKDINEKPLLEAIVDWHNEKVKR